MEGRACWAAVHGIAQSQTWLRDFTFTFHFHALEKEMATHSSVLAWRIPGTGEPGGLPPMGLHRVGNDWSDLAAVAAAAVSRYFGSHKMREDILDTDLCPSPSNVQGPENQLWIFCRKYSPCSRFRVQPAESHSGGKCPGLVFQR